MPESRFSPKTQLAIKKFTDRIEPFKVFNTWLDKIAEGKIAKKAIVYYGVGGIGKSRLITELMSEVDRKTRDNGKMDINILFASMDIHEYDSPIDVLMGLRKQIRFPCILFDYGLVKYLSAIGKNTEQIREFIPKNSVIWDVTSDILEAIHIPIGLVDKIMIKVRDKYSVQFREYRNEIDAINECPRNPVEIFERLPHLLGIDISLAANKKNSTFTVFLDSFESVYRKWNSNSLNDKPDEFIKELILSSSRTLFVIGSREYIKWEQEDITWNEILDQHILDYLSYADSDYFLKSVPIKEDDIRSSIIKSSEGLPLYLDLCVEIYLRKKQSGITKDDFIMPTDEIIPRFFSHISDGERTLFGVLSYLHYFDFRIFEITVKELNIPLSLSSFDEIIDHSFVLRVEDTEGIYKIHDNFYEYATHSQAINASKLVIDRIYTAILKYLNTNKKQIPVNSLKLLYPNLMKLLAYLPVQGTENGEQFLELSIYLIDKGLWNIVGSSSSGLMVKIDDPRIKFLYAVYLRRVGKLNEAANALLNVKAPGELFGSYKDYVMYYSADTLRVMGEFSRAIDMFQSIADKNKQDHNDIYFKCINQIGDLTFVSGNFRDALNILENAAGDIERNSLLYAELLRIEGHIYRFNFQLEQAIEKYLTSLKIAEKLGSTGLTGKIYNNLAESYCWFSPDKALEYGDLSLTANKTLNAPVEYGKTYAAMSIAYSMKNDFKQALKYSEKSLLTQHEIKYPGGEVYAYGSFCMAYLKAGEVEKFNEHFTHMKDIVNKLHGSVSYAMLPYYAYLHDIKIRDSIQWLNFDATLARVHQLFTA